MLRALYDQLNNFPPSQTLGGENFVEQTVKAFDALVDFLRSPETFPHGDINALVTLMWRLVGNKEIPTALDQWELGSLHFLVLGKGVQRAALFVIPLPFLDLVRKDPSMQLGAIVSMASQGKDYFSQHLDQHTPARALAYEAEMLQRLEKLHTDEGIAWKGNDYQQDILHKYPRGLSSLPSGVHYPTLAYPIERVQHFRHN